MQFKRILFILGTRPEAIKLAPLWYALRATDNRFSVKVCVTGQHEELLAQTLNFFNITPDYDLNVMEADQTLFDITSNVMKKLEPVLNEAKPDLIFVQGDTTSAFIGALAGFYKRIKVAHLEAGLRTHNKYSPFPEEINRVLVAHIADYHFAPTEQARKNLLDENITKNIWVVGNTIIDALFLTLKMIRENSEVQDQIISYFKGRFGNWEKIENGKIIFVTAHRRENFGLPFYNICNALKEIAMLFPDVNIIYPVHLNPNVRRPVFEVLGAVRNVHLLEPLDYQKTIWLMEKSFLVLTDSGGIQEEAPSLGKPVLVMRNVTERMEGIDAGTAKLVGSDKQKIITEVVHLFEDERTYDKMSRAANPYGDGNSSSRIVELIDSLQSISQQ